ncbi:MAG: NAD(P)/FAD-dependent oxidoreductase [Myxococcales bacterium]
MRTPSPAEPDVETLIIGTGFAGLGMAIRLQSEGFSDFVLIEKEPEIGGTWFVNTYPGCACDVQSHMYSFSFEPNPNWSREFASQPEILAYLKRCTEKYGLRPKIRFSTQAVGASYDEALCLWRVELARTEDVDRYLAQRGLKPGDTPPRDDPERPKTRVITARVVISAMGGLSTPAYPALEGLERFKGKTFHSQRWDHGYDLTGKRVAVIGTGASAIQFVPAIQPKAGRIDVYQRSAPWIMPKPDRAISKAERWLHRKLPATRLARRAALYAALESRAVAFVVDPRLMRFGEIPARIFRRLQVKDPALMRKVTPDYEMGCKRVLLSNDWYPALQKPNVDLITSGIREVREHSIVDAEGNEREVDAIIYGTGFRIADLIPRGVIVGRGGRDVVDGFRYGPEAYKGSSIAGCPNLFLLIGPNTGLGHNSIVYMIESQVQYVLGALKAMREGGLAELEVRHSVQTQFNDELQARSHGTIWEEGGCSSYYLDPQSGRNIAVWPDFTFKFRWLTRRFDLENYQGRAKANLPLAVAAVP